VGTGGTGQVGWYPVNVGRRMGRITLVRDIAGAIQSATNASIGT